MWFVGLVCALYIGFTLPFHIHCYYFVYFGLGVVLASLLGMLLVSFGLWLWVLCWYRGFDCLLDCLCVLTGFACFGCDLLLLLIVVDGWVNLDFLFIMVGLD